MGGLVVVAWLASAKRWYLPRAMERLSSPPGFLFAHRSEGKALQPLLVRNGGDIGLKPPKKSPASKLLKSHRSHGQILWFLSHDS